MTCRFVRAHALNPYLVLNFFGRVGRNFSPQETRQGPDFLPSRKCFVFGPAWAGSRLAGGVVGWF